MGWPPSSAISLLSRPLSYQLPNLLSSKFLGTTKLHHETWLWWYFWKEWNWQLILYTEPAWYLPTWFVPKHNKKYKITVLLAWRKTNTISAMIFLLSSLHIDANHVDCPRNTKYIQTQIQVQVQIQFQAWFFCCLPSWSAMEHLLQTLLRISRIAFRPTLSLMTVSKSEHKYRKFS